MSQDIDGDGDMDILPVQESMGLYWFENADSQGDNFIKRSVDNNVHNMMNADLVDFDSDGDPDILICVASSQFNYNKIFFYENMGNGNFASRVEFTGDAKYPRTCRAIDYDRDGDYDVVFGSDEDSKLYWMQNQGLYNFSNPKPVNGLENAPWELFVTDLTGDTLPDILASAYRNDQIAWYENLNNVGIQNNSHGEIALFPNPTRNSIHIHSPQIIRSAVISDMSGRKVNSRLKVDKKDMEWDLTGLQSGVYLLHIYTDAKVFSSKVQKR